MAEQFCAGCGTADVDWCERCAEKGNWAAVNEALDQAAEQIKAIQAVSFTEMRNTMSAIEFKSRVLAVLAELRGDDG